MSIRLRQGFGGQLSMRTSTTESFRIIGADHTGITVSNLERSLALWRDVLGFEFSHTAHQKGELAQEITGVEGAEIKLAVLRAPGGHKIELLEYLAPADRKRANLRPCDVGSVHVALLVEDLNAVLDRIAASGWASPCSPEKTACMWMGISTALLGKPTGSPACPPFNLRPPASSPRGRCRDRGGTPGA